MAKLEINDGTTANDGTGDSLRVAAFKINQNFTELYSDIANIAEVGLSGDYLDLINLPSIPQAVRDLNDPFLDLEQVRGTMTSSIITDGGFYSIGEDAQPLRAIYITEVNSGTGPNSELNLIGSNGVTIDADTQNLNLTSNICNITTTGPLNISSQQVNIIGQVAADISGNVTGNDGTSLVDGTNSEIVGPINNNNDVTLSGNVNLTGATVTGLSYNDLDNLPVIPSIPTIPSDLSDLTDTTNIISDLQADISTNATNISTLSSSLATVATSGDYNDLSNLPDLASIQTDISDLAQALVDADTDTVPEGTLNLYYTDTRVQTYLVNNNYATTADIPTVPTDVGDLTDTTGLLLDASDYISLATLKAEVAASTDFADFQTRIAAL